MSAEENYPIVRAYFEFLHGRFVTMAGEWVDDPEAVVADAETRFEAMIPDLAYVDDPGHPMAMSLFFTAVNLAMHLALRERGVGTHDFGPVLLGSLIEEPLPDVDVIGQMDAFKAAGDASLEGAKPGEFVFEVVTEGDDFDWGMDVKSCGICFLFSQHDAMDFVPYMCAGDDVLSDQMGDGLRRTGTIALGAHQCDFRYQKGGQPLPLAGQYPQQIQIRSPGS